MFLFTLPGFAADKPDVTGKWVIDTEKSEFGEGQAITDISLTIRVEGAELYVTQSSPDGTLNFHFNMEKKETTNDVPGGAVMKSTYWWEGDVLAGEHKIDTADGQIMQKDRITFSGDGKTITLARTTKAENGDAVLKLVMNKK